MKLKLSCAPDNILLQSDVQAFMKLIQNLPNLLTLFNLFLGCMGIVYLFNDHTVIMTGKQEFYIDMGLIHISCYCVMLAGIVDFF